jgi:tetratricopeptide (TPR) repeat protein
MKQITVAAFFLLVLGGSPAVAVPTPVGLPDFTRLWDFDHPDSTEARLREILPAARAADDADYLSQLLTQVARSQGLQGRFEEAHRTLDEADSLIRPEMHRARVRSLLERGRTLNSSDRPDQARPLFVAAWDLARATGEENLAVDAAHMVAIVEPPDSALVWNRRAMAYAETAKDPAAKDWLGSLYNNLGWSLHDRGDFAGALEVFRRAWDWRKAHHQPKETRIAAWCVARTLRSLERVDEALRMQQELQAEWEASGAQSDGYVYEEMGECLWALGRPEEARPWFARAYADLSKDTWLMGHETARLQRLAKLGGVQVQE